jgi:hypothetical protein
MTATFEVIPDKVSRTRGERLEISPGRLNKVKTL